MRSLFPVFTWYPNIPTDYAFGVADGVGGWRQHGVDPGEFSRTVLISGKTHLQLVENMKNAITVPVTNKEDLKWKAISVAQATCNSVVSANDRDDSQNLGSSTLCAVALGKDNKAFFYNIGDSGLYILRYEQPKKGSGDETSSDSKEWCIHDFTPKQCHSFNFPFQLGKGADNVRFLGCVDCSRRAGCRMLWTFFLEICVWLLRMVYLTICGLVT